MNAYYAGAAKLGAALGRDGALPAWFATGSQAGEIPRRSLGLGLGLGLTALAIVAITGVGTEPLVLATTGAFVAVYAVGVAAAIRLLPRRTKAWWTAVIAFATVVLLMVATGIYLAWPLLIGAAALGYVRHRNRHSPDRELPAHL